MDITYSARLPEDTTQVLVPGGLATPYGACVSVMAPGLREVHEATTSQRAFHMTPSGPDLEVTFRFDTTSHPYPDAIFTHRPSRFTRFADDLVAEVAAIGTSLSEPERARAIACHVAERFTYGHPETAFNDGLEEIPSLGCGLTTGSCVDINTYFIAALRAAGIEAGYITGFFFPEEKQGTCEDGHCWVVTRTGGETQEWDIAHHLKLGTRDIRPGLNPKPGVRFACFHSMGLAFPDLNVSDLKALIEPLAIGAEGQIMRFDAPNIQYHAAVNA